MPLSSRRPLLTDRLTAFSVAVDTLGALVGDEFFDLTDARVQAAIINAAAALVIGADLTLMDGLVRERADEDDYPKEDTE